MISGALGASTISKDTSYNTQISIKRSFLFDASQKGLEDRRFTFEISSPKNTQQSINVVYNESSHQFEGLPSKWRQLLFLEPTASEVSDITEDLQLKRGVKYELQDTTAESSGHMG